MRRPIRLPVGLAALGGGAVVAVALVEPGHTTLALDAYFVYLGALVLFTLTRLTRELATGESEFDAALRAQRQRPARETTAVSELARLEREVTLARVAAFDLHYRLRPTLREVAAHKLRSRHGVELDGEPDRARPLVGDLSWELLRADRPPPLDRHGPGLELAELRELVDTLERL